MFFTDSGHDEDNDIERGSINCYFFRSGRVCPQLCFLYSHQNMRIIETLSNVGGQNCILFCLVWKPDLQASILIVVIMALCFQCNFDNRQLITNFPSKLFPSLFSLG